MGEKLSPPLLDGTIPAFCENKLLIPYSMSRAVSLTNEVSGFQIKIKKIQSGIQLLSGETTSYENNLIEYTISEEDKKKLTIGQFYKVQIAYIKNDEEKTIGHFSTAAIVKYTAKPDLFIEGLAAGTLNSHRYTYTGVYKNDEDKNERVYSYKFNLYEKDNGNNYKVIDTSGDLLHDARNDDGSGESSDTYTFTQDLIMGKNYWVEYLIKTINGFEGSTDPDTYRITQTTSVNPELKASLIAELNYENGYVNLKLVADSNEELSHGNFIVARSSEDSNYMIWDNIHTFNLNAQIATRELCKDFTVEQGKKYKYSIQQYSDILYSNRLLSNELFIDFEDAFLYDGERQLKIKYNPRISSFKKNLLETKTDTIGGQHPFIFRNGRVYYTEFPISGLISYQSDEEQLFMTEADYGLEEKTISFTGDNIAAERVFKLRVLEWLTNGKPKIFRSPTEGNYIVRLMNISLSPNDTTGRMLHTFNCTAYEVANFDYSTLGEMGFITVGHSDITSMRWETKMLKDIPANTNFIKGKKVKTLRFDNMMPGDNIIIYLEGVGKEYIQIGATGSYYVDIGTNITGIALVTKVNYGSVTYSYQFTKPATFQYISDATPKEVPHQQFIGEKDIMKELLYVKDSQNNWIKNPKIEISNIYNINVEKRPLQRITDFELNNKGEVIIKADFNDPFIIYEFGNYIDPGVAPDRHSGQFNVIGYYDAYNKIRYKPGEYNPTIVLNGENISVNELEHIDIYKPENVTSLTAGNGVVVNLTYSYVEIVFKIEDEAMKVSEEDTDNPLYTLQQLKSTYDGYYQTLDTPYKKDEEFTTEKEESLETARNNIASAYESFILELVDAQEQSLIREGKA